MALVLFTAIGIGLSGLTSRVHPAATLVVRELSGYPLDDRPIAAAQFPGNDLVFVGSLTAFEASQWSSTDVNSGHIYTPVVISIDEVIRGRYDGDAITVQSLGGQVGNVQMVVDDAVRLTDVPLGSKLILFMSSRESRAGIPRAPNMAYVIDENGLARSLTRSDNTIAASAFIELVRSTPHD